MPKDTNQTELLSNPEQLQTEPLEKLEQLSKNPLQLNYSTLTDPEQSIRALETMYELSMLQTDIDMDAELRANLTFEKICINELLKSI